MECWGRSCLVIFVLEEKNCVGLDRVCSWLVGSKLGKVLFSHFCSWGKKLGLFMF